MGCVWVYMRERLPYKSMRDNVERDYGLCGERSFSVTEGTTQTLLLPFLLNTVNLDQATLNYSMAEWFGALVLKSGGTGFKATSRICFSLVPSSNHRSRFANSQLACLIPVEFLTMLLPV